MIVTATRLVVFPLGDGLLWFKNPRSQNSWFSSGWYPTLVNFPSLMLFRSIPGGIGYRRKKCEGIFWFEMGQWPALQSLTT